MHMLKVCIETHSFYSGTVCCANLAPSALIRLTFAGVVGAEGIGLKYSNAVPAPPASVVSSSSLSCPTVSVGFGVLAARGVSNVAVGVPRLPPLPGVLGKDVQ